MTQVKICGIKNNQALETAIEAGARWVGFIIFPKSPRHIDMEAAGALVRAAAGRVKPVAVVVDPDDPMLYQLASVMKPDIIQLHGGESPERCQDVKAYAREGVWKAFGIRDSEDLKRAAPYRDVVDGFVFDAKPPKDADRPGGLGVSFDWTLLKNVSQNPPWLLSGWLDPDNVQDAIRIAQAGAVDVSSGVESAPGIKDLTRIRDFMAAAHGPAPSHK